MSLIINVGTKEAISLFSKRLSINPDSVNLELLIDTDL